MEKPSGDERRVGTSPVGPSESERERVDLPKRAGAHATGRNALRQASASGIASESASASAHESESKGVRRQGANYEKQDQ